MEELFGTAISQRTLVGGMSDDVPERGENGLRRMMSFVSGRSGFWMQNMRERMTRFLSGESAQRPMGRLRPALEVMKKLPARASPPEAAEKEETGPFVKGTKPDAL